MNVFKSTQKAEQAAQAVILKEHCKGCVSSLACSVGEWAQLGNGLSWLKAQLLAEVGWFMLLLYTWCCTGSAPCGWLQKSLWA